MMGYKGKKHWATTQKPAMLTHCHQHVPKVHTCLMIYTSQQTSQWHLSKETYQQVIRWTYVGGSSTQPYGPNLASAWTARHDDHLGYDGQSLARNWSENFLNVKTVTVVLAHLVDVRQPHAHHSPTAPTRGTTQNTHSHCDIYDIFNIQRTVHRDIFV